MIGKHQQKMIGSSANIKWEMGGAFRQSLYACKACVSLSKKASKTIIASMPTKRGKEIYGPLAATLC